METIRLKDIFPMAVRDMILTRSTRVFMPDQWTRTFAHGLAALSEQPGFTSSGVLEVGVGIGINMAGIFSLPRAPAHFTGLDINRDAVDASSRLALELGRPADIQLSDLLLDLPPENGAAITHIVACIPQVPADVDLDQDDNSAHYYIPTGTDWDLSGLGLNARLLDQASRDLPHASMTLNLAGRPGLDRLHGMFNQYGYDARILHSDMVEQHAETSLEGLAQLERQGCQPFEFFADAAGDTRITAAQAEACRVDNRKIFHRLYVLHAPAPAASPAPVRVPMASPCPD